MKKAMLCICALGIFIMLTACGEVEKYTTTEKAVAYLASDELGGRLPNTKGNEMAQDYIANALKQMKIEPFENEYKNTFSYKMADISSARITAGDIVLQKEAFEIGNAPPAGGEFAGEICTVDNVGEQDCILFTDEYNFYKLIKKDNVKGVVVRREPLDRKMVVYEKSFSEKPVVLLSGEDYDKLIKIVGQKATIAITSTEKTIQENNIVGVIRADKNPLKQAVVLSAHFDHLGSRGDNIYHGALDNASGTAALLYAAQTLSQQLKAADIERDVYFAFFNNEETGLSFAGSFYFAQQVQDVYGGVFNINIDCIGEKGKKDIIVGASNRNSELGKTLERDISTALAKVGRNAESALEVASDHVNFENSVNISTGFGTANTIGDTVDLLDYSEIDYIAQAVTDYAKELAEGLKVMELPKPPAAWHPTKAKDPTIFDDEIIELNSGWRCKAINYKGKPIHLMTGTAIWEIKGDNDALKKAGFFDLRLDTLLPKSDRLVTVSHIAAVQAPPLKDAGNFVSLPEDGICPYTGLTLDQHELNKVYEAKYNAEDIGYINCQAPSQNGDINVWQFRVKDSKNIDKIFNLMEETDSNMCDFTAEYKGYSCYNYDKRFIKAIVENDEFVYELVYDIGDESPIAVTKENLGQVLEDNGVIAVWDEIVRVLEK